MRKILKQREDSWVVKLRTLSPDGFNKELNDPATRYLEKRVKKLFPVHLGLDPLLLQLRQSQYDVTYMTSNYATDFSNR